MTRMIRVPSGVKVVVVVVVVVAPLRHSDTALLPDLQGARLTHSPQRMFPKKQPYRNSSQRKDACTRNSYRDDLLRNIVPLCEMLYTEPQAITTVPAQRTHEAAREGFVPLCEDSLWNPRESLESPHSGLMRQPTKEEPVWNSLGTV